MNYYDFLNSIEQQKIPNVITKHQESLWYKKKGSWDTAHSIFQKISDTLASSIHAYLYKKEHDTWNLKYCYNRANAQYIETPFNNE